MELVQEYAADLGIHHGLSPIPVVGLVGAAQREELPLPATPWTWTLEKTELDCSGLSWGCCHCCCQCCHLAARDGFRPSISRQHSGPAQCFPKKCPDTLPWVCLGMCAPVLCLEG